MKNKYIKSYGEFVNESDKVVDLNDYAEEINSTIDEYCEGVGNMKLECTVDAIDTWMEENGYVVSNKGDVIKFARRYINENKNVNEGLVKWIKGLFKNRQIAKEVEEEEQEKIRSEFDKLAHTLSKEFDVKKVGVDKIKLIGKEEDIPKVLDKHYDLKKSIGGSYAIHKPYRLANHFAELRDNVIKLNDYTNNSETMSKLINKKIKQKKEETEEPKSED